MGNIRLIPRLDIKGPNVIKGVRLEGLRVVGDPQEIATSYYEQGADEMIYIDVVASLYGRNYLTEVVRRTAKNIFVPLTVGGGIRSPDDAKTLLREGADKVAINTAAIKHPELIRDIAHKFGSQCVVLSVAAKKVSEGKWEALTDNGRERTGRDVIEWVCQAVELGAGQILATSVDQEGTGKGFDVELIREISNAVSVPVIASGGMGTLEHLLEVVKEGQADAVAMADILHYKRMTLPEIRNGALEAGIHVRHFEPH